MGLDNEKVMIMLEKSMTPEQLKKLIFQAIRTVNEEKTPIEIVGKTENESAVLISKNEYEKLQSELNWNQDAEMEIVQKRMRDNSGFTDITNGIDWDNL
ncbi:type II toxin-antitoxin system prevent-host-death family antitoxin [Companilactobacillus furfuricola]|uniref:type II toxin-antitoxin system prevent-host-death family antitoxin n=1 Tax=Companilactobacillus furfuricola TaxID=1462575 RepID=UPI001B867680|nr:type II toxin-antitoxin system prevent-host-death family antitoxin [Companilactobacillus furfuricola]